jgi:hypothetical protein
MGKKDSDLFSQAETARRAEAALRAAFNTPPKHQSDMKLGKPGASRPKGPTKSTRKKPR